MKENSYKISKTDNEIIEKIVILRHLQEFLNMSFTKIELLPKEERFFWCCFSSADEDLLKTTLFKQELTQTNQLKFI
jgi:hypothetical protein